MSGVSGDLKGFNLYAYCFNNPVNMTDSSGNWPKWVEKIANAFVAIFNSVEAELSVGVGIGAKGSSSSNAPLSISISIGGYIGIGAGVSLGINLSELWDRRVEIFSN